MTDEEKEALKNFKSEYESCDHYSSDLIIELDDAEIILNLIEKQSKEIEELKKPKYIINFEKNEITKLTNDFVSKEKIKERIKEYYEYDKRMQNKPDWHTTKYYEAKALEKLLEE